MRVIESWVNPSWAMLLMAYTIGAIVISDSPMLSTSTGPGVGSFDSGTKIGARISSSTSTGTAIRKTEPHQ